MSFNPVALPQIRSGYRHTVTIAMHSGLWSQRQMGARIGERKPQSIPSTYITSQRHFSRLNSYSYKDNQSPCRVLERKACLGGAGGGGVWAWRATPPPGPIIRPNNSPCTPPESPFLRFAYSCTYIARLKKQTSNRVALFIKLLGAFAGPIYYANLCRWKGES